MTPGSSEIVRYSKKLTEVGNSVTFGLLYNVE